MKSLFTRPLSLFALILASCSGSVSGEPTQDGANAPFRVTPVATFEEPWALAFLPGTSYALVTEKAGTLRLWHKDGTITNVSGVPPVFYDAKSGLGDIVPAPDFAKSGIVYLSWAEAGANDTRGAAVGRARLVLDGSPRLEELTVLWRQHPKVTGSGHYAHRLIFSPDGQYLFVSSGDRQKMAQAQDLSGELGKIIRLRPDGVPPQDNPFAARGGPAGHVWSYGHRNPLGLKFDATGRLWALEHGPRGGDELNLVRPGANYGWPLVSGGDHYDGRAIPRHATRPDLAPPAISWNPVIAPGDFIFYGGAHFPQWRGHALIAALSGSLVDVRIEGEQAYEVARHDFGARLREIAEREDGTVWLLEDGPGGRLLRLDPPSSGSTAAPAN